MPSLKTRTGHLLRTGGGHLSTTCVADPCGLGVTFPQKFNALWIGYTVGAIPFTCRDSYIRSTFSDPIYVEDNFQLVRSSPCTWDSEGAIVTAFVQPCTACNKALFCNGLRLSFTPDAAIISKTFKCDASFDHVFESVIAWDGATLSLAFPNAITQLCNNADPDAGDLTPIFGGVLTIDPAP